MSVVAKIFVGVLLVVAASLGAGPYFVGIQAEKFYRSAVVGLANKGVIIQLDRYERRWFSATSEYRVSLDPALFLGVPPQVLEMLSGVIFYDDIQHGPFVSADDAFAPGILAFKTSYQLSDEARNTLSAEPLQWLEKIEQVTQGQPLVAISGWMSVGGRWKTSIKTLALADQTEDYSLRLTPMRLMIESDLHFDQYISKLHWQGFELSFDDWNISTKSVSSEEHTEIVKMLFLMNSDGVMHVQGFSITSGVDENVQFDDLTIDVGLKTEGSRLSARYQWLLKGLKTSQNLEVSEFQGAAALANIEEEKIRNIVDLYAHLSSLGMNEDPDMETAMRHRLFSDAIPAFLVLLSDIQFSLRNVILTTPQGQLQGRLSLAIGTLGPELQNKLALIMNEITGDADFSFDRAILTPDMQESLNVAVMMGFFKVEGDQLKSQLSLREGVLEVNGQKLPLGAMVQQNAQIQPSVNQRLITAPSDDSNPNEEAISGDGKGQ